MALKSLYWLLCAPLVAGFGTTIVIPISYCPASSTLASDSGSLLGPTASSSTSSSASSSTLSLAPSASGNVQLTIQVLPQRNARNEKRQSDTQGDSGLFVQPDGSVSPHCSRGASYSLFNGQLTADGLLLSADPTEDYVTFTGSSTVKSISTQFGLGNGTLAWVNPGFKAGHASFCALNGFVVASFTVEPPAGCIPVAVSSRPVAACPNYSGHGVSGLDPDSPFTSLCPAYDGNVTTVVTAVGTAPYEIECDTTFQGQDLTIVGALSLIDCLRQCSGYTGCNGATYDSTNYNCVLKGIITSVARSLGSEAGRAINSAYPSPTDHAYLVSTPGFSSTFGLPTPLSSESPSYSSSSALYSNTTTTGATSSLTFANSTITSGAATESTATLSISSTFSDSASTSSTTIESASSSSISTSSAPTNSTSSGSFSAGSATTESAPSGSISAVSATAGSASSGSISTASASTVSASTNTALLGGLSILSVPTVSASTDTALLGGLSIFSAPTATASTDTALLGGLSIFSAPTATASTDTALLGGLSIFSVPTVSASTDTALLGGLSIFSAPTATASTDTALLGGISIFSASTATASTDTALLGGISIASASTSSVSSSAPTSTATSTTTDQNLCSTTGQSYRGSQYISSAGTVYDIECDADFRQNSDGTKKNDIDKTVDATSFQKCAAACDTDNSGSPSSPVCGAFVWDSSKSTQNCYLIKETSIIDGGNNQYDRVHINNGEDYSTNTVGFQSGFLLYGDGFDTNDALGDKGDNTKPDTNKLKLKNPIPVTVHSMFDGLAEATSTVPATTFAGLNGAFQFGLVTTTKLRLSWNGFIAFGSDTSAPLTDQQNDQGDGGDTSASLHSLPASGLPSNCLVVFWSGYSQLRLGVQYGIYYQVDGTVLSIEFYLSRANSPGTRVFQYIVTYDTTKPGLWTIYYFKTGQTDTDDFGVGKRETTGFQVADALGRGSVPLGLDMTPYSGKAYAPYGTKIVMRTLLGAYSITSSKFTSAVQPGSWDPSKPPT